MLVGLYNAVNVESVPLNSSRFCVPGDRGLGRYPVHDRPDPAATTRSRPSRRTAARDAKLVGNGGAGGNAGSNGFALLTASGGNGGDARLIGNGGGGNGTGGGPGAIGGTRGLLFGTNGTSGLP